MQYSRVWVDTTTIIIIIMSLIQIWDGILTILQFTENDENFFKRFVFESISNLLLNIFWLS